MAVFSFQDAHTCRSTKLAHSRWLFVLRSHNTKTTTWLDPRLAKKAKPPEKCEDGGMHSRFAAAAAAAASTQAYISPH